MKLLRSHAMQDDLIRCISMLGFSIYLVNQPEVDQWQKNIAVVGLLLIMLMSLLQIWQALWQDKRMTPEEKREAEREKSDERSRMIQDRAMRNCWGLEDALLIIAMFVCIVQGRLDVCGILYLVLTGRELACVAVRWWLERKY